MGTWRKLSRGPRWSNKRKLAEIESDDGARGSEAERAVKRQNQDRQTGQNMDQPGEDVRAQKKKGRPGDWLLREETA